MTNFHQIALALYFFFFFFITSSSVFRRVRGNFSVGLVVNKLTQKRMHGLVVHD